MRYPLTEGAGYILFLAALAICLFIYQTHPQSRELSRAAVVVHNSGGGAFDHGH